eukprot:TRINITY_DN1699_c2_g3_i4.p2 TRINITY_DN1699_c2_g3~~TRINITY_DN1699_c2_g3_i4.p2  ORF type:complete len:213 (+),score=-1.51 TRINITY_DN1699_c2_g3_i4:403-1041(+)
MKKPTRTLLRLIQVHYKRGLLVGRAYQWRGLNSGRGLINGRIRYVDVLFVFFWFFIIVIIERVWQEFLYTPYSPKGGDMTFCKFQYFVNHLDKIIISFVRDILYNIQYPCLWVLQYQLFTLIITKFSSRLQKLQLKGLRNFNFYYLVCQLLDLQNFLCFQTAIFSELFFFLNITMWAGVPSEPLCLHTQSLATAQNFEIGVISEITIIFIVT